MRKVRFRNAAGQSRTGQWTENGIEYGNQTLDPKDVQFLSPCKPSKILAVGPNHESNVERPHRDRPSSTDELAIFIKSCPKSVVAHDETVNLPSTGEYIFELELGIVVGEECFNVSPDHAESYIEGYTCVNEITKTDLPDTMAPGGSNWTRAKSFDNSAPIGPVVATADEVPEDAEMELKINGETRQQATRSEMLYDGPELIAEISRYMTLEPGDVIASGSPSGADQLHDGDNVMIEIQGIGTLKHDVEIG